MAYDSADDNSYITARESGGNPNAKNPRSSAEGADQFLNSTWLGMVHKYRPDLEEGRTQQGILDLRRNKDISGEMRDAYAKENQAYLQGRGLPVSPGSTYLAHFLGPTGAAAVLSANPDTPVRDILGSKVIAANPFLANMTAGQMLPWASGGLKAPAISQSANVGAAPPIGAPQMAQGSPFVPAATLVAQKQNASPQPLQGGGQGDASGMATPLNAPTPSPAQLMQAPAFRPQVDMSRLQSMMAAYPQLRGLLPLFSG